MADRFVGATGVAVDAKGTLYVADEEAQNIRSLTVDGKNTVIAGQHFSYAYNGKRFTLPGRAVVNATGTLYVADPIRHVIYQIAPTGKVGVFAGSEANGGSVDGSGAEARFRKPSAVAVDAAGTVYVADAGNHTIRKISLTGVVTTLAGAAGSPGTTNGPAAAARFNQPTGVAVDAAGTVYVADRGNQLIRQISPAGVVSTLAGQPGVPGIADGTGPNARFNDPEEVTVDAAGAVYVVDRGSRTIRVIH